MQVVSQAAQNSEPVLVFCKVGKDRTGMLACLIAACCGATPSQLVADYHKWGPFCHGTLGSCLWPCCELPAVLVGRVRGQRVW